MNNIVIAIDGHSSTGKSTVAKALAKQLGYIYIDSGAMYRCIALFGMQQKIVRNKTIDKAELIKRLPEIKIDFVSQNNQQLASLNGVLVENEIRSLEVSQNVSPVATIKEVRAFLVEQQQKLGASKGIVMDGRDIGTVVFPEAELKIFMTASAQIRAQRRYDEHLAKGEQIDFDSILENVIERDHIDENRAESPLRQAHDALLLDNGKMSRTEQLEWCIEQVEKAKQKNKH